MFVCHWLCQCPSVLSNTGRASGTLKTLREDVEFPRPRLLYLGPDGDFDGGVER